VAASRSWVNAREDRSIERPGIAISNAESNGKYLDGSEFIHGTKITAVSLSAWTSPHFRVLVCPKSPVLQRMGLFLFPLWRTRRG
jgi:hypothetical protein